MPRVVHRCQDSCIAVAKCYGIGSPLQRGQNLHAEVVMGNGKGGGGKGGGGGRPANGPSTTGGKSGGGRGNNPPSK